MLVAAAVCPHPPLLVPEVASGAAYELESLRTACDEAVRRLVATAPDTLIVVGSDAQALAMGEWLLDRAAPDAPRRRETAAAGATSADCAALGAELAARADRVALLVMGDGSACRTEKAPGYLDERAGSFDAAVVAALGKPDPQALLSLDPGLARELMAAGRAPWQVLAGAARDGACEAELLYDAAPYGVGYFVACWTVSSYGGAQL